MASLRGRPLTDRFSGVYKMIITKAFLYNVSVSQEMKLIESTYFRMRMVAMAQEPRGGDGVASCW